MDKTVVIKAINNLKNNLFFVDKDDYKNKLIDYLSNDRIMIGENKLEILLGEKAKKNIKDVYREGVAELLLYFLLMNKGIEFIIESPENPDSKHNVDVVIENYNNLHINFEVKCPVIPEVDTSSYFHGELSYRFNDDKEGVVTFINNLNDEINSAAKKSGKKGSQISLPRDNKIKDTLLSCQEKFPEPNKDTLNCLIINTNSSEMIAYWNYIANECQTGFFDANSYLDHTKFDKVNAVVLTNGIELNEQYSAISWDLDRACVVILINCFSKAYDELGKNGKFLELFSLFPKNIVCDYIKKSKDNISNKKEPLPDGMLKIELVRTWSFTKNAK